jgi:hypothetical protein
MGYNDNATAIGVVEFATEGDDDQSFSSPLFILNVRARGLSQYLGLTNSTKKAKSYAC